MMAFSTSRALLLAWGLMVGVTSAQDYETTQVFAPIPFLNVTAYLGRWFQTHADPFFIALELGGRCATADYSLTAAGNVALVNTARPLLIPQQFARTTGFAYQNPGSFVLDSRYALRGLSLSLLTRICLSNLSLGPGPEGAFTVEQVYLKELDEDGAFEPEGNYWIIGIGPIVNGLYSWAAVSNPQRSLAFIIARDAKTFFGSDAEEEALQIFKDFDFPIKSFPQKTSHFACFGYPDK